MTAEIFSNWFLNCFLPKISPTIDPNMDIHFLCDNCSAHPQELDDLDPSVRILSLSLLQKLIFWYMYGSFASKSTTLSYGLYVAIKGAIMAPAADDPTAEGLFAVICVNLSTTAR